MDDFYPMPAFVKLIVSDLERSMDWYERILGFRRVYLMPGPNGDPILAHLRFARYADLLLTPSAAPSEAGAGVTLCYTMPEQRTVDDLAEQLRQHGHTPEEGPIDRPWNVRELIVCDPDGYRLSFTQLANAALNLDEVVQQVQKS